MKRLLCLALVSVSVAILGVLLPRGGIRGEAEAADQHYEMIAPLDALMTHVDTVFYDLPDLVEKKKFKKVRQNSYVLAEFGNIFHHAEEYEDNKLWGKLVEEMRSGFMKLADVAKKKDKAAFTELHTKLEANCESCHEQIRDV